MHHKVEYFPVALPFVDLLPQIVLHLVVVPLAEELEHSDEPDELVIAILGLLDRVVHVVVVDFVLDLGVSPDCGDGGFEGLALDQ